MTYLQHKKQFMGQESNLTIKLHVPPLYIIDDHVIDDRNDITISSSNGSSNSSSRRSGIRGLVGCEYTLQEGESSLNSMYQVPAAPVPALHTAPQHRMTINTSMTSTIPAPPMPNQSLSSAATDGVTYRSNTSSTSKSRQQKQSQAEIHRLWENEYVTDQVMRGRQHYI